MNNAQFKLECLKNGLYSPEQLIEFFNVVYGDDHKFNKRDAQLWLNGKVNRSYEIDHKAIDLINRLNYVRNEIILNESENIKQGKQSYKFLFKNELQLWQQHKEFFNLPINFYNSVLIELKIYPIDYFNNN